jgi:integrase
MPSCWQRDWVPGQSDIALYPIIALALATGMRRGELLALRWGDLDLDAGRIQVERSLEQTKGGLRFKEPKTKHGRRSIKIPPSVVTELKAHWAQQQAQRLGLDWAAQPMAILSFPVGTARQEVPTPLLANGFVLWRKTSYRQSVCTHYVTRTRAN